MDKKSIKDQLSLFTLIMVTSAFVTSIRNLPTIAETGLKMIFFGVIAAVCYLIPISLVSAELATAWPKQGGIYVWVKEAFGRRWGFVAIWLQWVYMTISMIAMLYFIAGSLAFVISPTLATNRTYLVICSLVILWVFTLLNLRGLSLSSKISTIGFLSGVLFPGVLIIFLGLLHVYRGNPIAFDTSLTVSNLIPDFKHIANIVLLVGFMRAFAGIEASATHANKVNNPQRNYPIAIFIVVIIGLAINILGSLSVAAVIPRESINLEAGVMDAFVQFFKNLNVGWIIPVLGILVAIGQMGGACTWLLGPVKGLHATALSGDLPKFFQRVNNNGVPRNLLIIQAIWISIVSSALLIFTAINQAFWFSVAFSMMIYVTAYFLMLLSGLYLRYKAPDAPRAYRIPFKNVGMWVVTCLGMVTMVFSFFVALFPPAELPSGNKTLYQSLLIGGIIIVFAIPFIIESRRRPSWKPENTEEK